MPNPNKNWVSFSVAPENPRVSMGSPSPICMPLIARRKGKLILHGKGNRRPMAIKPPMQEKLISSRMGNPNKSDQNGKCAKYRPLPWGNPPPAILTCKNGKSNIAPEGKSAFIFLLFSFAYISSFSLRGKHPTYLELRRKQTSLDPTSGTY